MHVKCVLQRSMKTPRSLIRPFNRNELNQASYPSDGVGLLLQFSSIGASIKWPSSISKGEKRLLHARDGDQILTEVGVDDSFDVKCAARESPTNRSLLPPPPPEPAYSVHRRVLPTSLTAMASPKGRRYLLEALSGSETNSVCFWSLIEQFLNQSEPTYCGITTLVMVLNAMSVDPGVRWRGGWRFYGSEDVLLDRCCFSAERVRRTGINMEEFNMIGKCHGLGVEMKRPAPQSKNGGVDSFRDDLRATMTDGSSISILVVSFSRSHLKQTGEGHFSPVAAYHTATDQALILDVARFKYPPYWVPIKDLYDAMIPIDRSTNSSRGWFLLHPPKTCNGNKKDTEARRPAELVPALGEEDACPMGRLKRRYCKANREESTN